MAFSKKTWKDRVSQYINRRLLTDSDGNTQQVTVTRDEGSVTEAGDAFSASNMNDLEDRIEAAIPTKIQDLDNVNLTTSDNNKLLGVSVSGSDISVVAVAPTQNNIQAVKGSYSGIKGVYGGYISGSKNYFDFLIPCNTNGLTSITNISFTSIAVLTANGRSDNPFQSYTIDVTPMGLFVDCRFTSTQAASISGVVTFDGLAFTAS